MSTGEPMVTVLIPSYNHARFLPERIESILSQTYTNFELIVIDDHSSDQSDKIIRRYTPLPFVTYIRNESNSGTPFAAWEKGSRMAKGKYIWLCESDDFAERDFLRQGVEALEENSNCVLFYCNSHVVDVDSHVVGNSSEYFDEIWRDTRWKQPFIASGLQELESYQIRGQTVPNMSSALIRRDAFVQAYTKQMKKYKLTGDWLFVGLVMQYGDVMFDPQSLNNFRKHQNTSRVRVKSDRSQAEYILTKYYLHRVLKRKDRELLPLLSSDATRHIYEDAGGLDVVKLMLRISVPQTISLAAKLVGQIMLHPEYLKKYVSSKKALEKS